MTTALFAFWTARSDAAAAQQAKGNVDVGGRSGVTAGGHMDQIARLLAGVAVAAGAPAEAVYYKAPTGDPNKRDKIAHRYTLPSYFRPTKSYDVVVYDTLGEPCVIVELKSQSGSYSNNANNRAEEAIGNAVDLQRALDEGLVPGDPWTGYVFLIEDDDISRASGGAKDSAAFPRDPIFADWTYQSRVRLLCQRLVEDEHYVAAWAVTTSRPECAGEKICPVILQQARLDKEAAKKGWPTPERLPHEHRFDWSEMSQDTGFVQFTASMTARIRAAYPQGPGATAAEQLALPGA
ncbi:PaeR7I family type II restriction endonuclease [Quadrisphaera granulorum]|uniref:PaeR7I family type II restriction endonuclease n=1 Tax=Quadrisphaera granulorum TaxID=317664 RepID=UPI00147613E2|nr:PaeR7I family type II restriction endonuclease [Quadrisphaera granulorum]